MWIRPGAGVAAMASVILVLAACGGPTAATPSPASPAMTPGLVGTLGSSTTPTASGTSDATGLPEPSLTDAADINAALFDPTRVDVAVVSLIAQLGIAIDNDDGTALRPGAGSAFPDFHLRAAEVRGLIDMGRADAVGLTHGQVTWTLANLAAGLAPLTSGLSQQEVLDRYIAAYRATPGDFVRAILDGHPFLLPTAFTRVHLWLLLVDGVLGRHGPGGTAAGSTRTVSFLETAAAPVATVSLPLVPSPIPGLDARDYALVLAHLPLLGYQVPITFAVTPTQAHEGHGGLGPTVAFDARNVSAPTPLLSVVDGHPLLTPTRSGLDGVPVSFESPDQATLEAHGTLLGAFGVPISTDASGLAHLGYQVQSEEANGSGDIHTANATVEAVVDLQQLVLSQYALDPSILTLVWGTRRIPAGLQIEWHEAPAPTGNENGSYDITLRGPKAGAGHYIGSAEVYCTGTPDTGRLLWSVTAIPAGATITQFLLMQEAKFDTMQVTTSAQADFDPWVARSDLAGETANVTESGSGNAIRIEGHGSWTDSDGHIFTIAVIANCSMVDQ